MDESRPDTRQYEHDPYIGRVFGGRYTVESKIGRGGMGHVYLAEQKGLGRKVVVKVLVHDPESESTNAVDRFMREAQALSVLNHTNIVHVHDYGRNVEESYIVMEYVDGMRLDTLIKRTNRLSLDIFVLIARQMLDAIGEAHDQRIIHRDLKPSNIMLTVSKGAPYYVKVLDFGLAKLLNEESDLTGQHSLVGSLSYLAPEQILGEAVDQSADIYSIGVLFYYMLSGRKPFLGQNTRVLYQHIHEPPEPLDEVLPADHGIPPRIIQLVHACLSKNPKDRPADANVLLSLLLESFDSDFLSHMRGPNDFSNPSFSGLSALSRDSSVDRSRDSADIVRLRQTTDQQPHLGVEGSSPSFSSPSHRALVLPEGSVDEASLPLLDMSVNIPRRASPWKPAFAALLLLVLGAGGALIALQVMKDPAPAEVPAQVASRAAAMGEEEEEAAAMQEEPAQEPPAAPARHTLTSVPTGATVMIAGKKRGETPLTLELPEGTYEATLKLSGHEELIQELVLAAGAHPETEVMLESTRQARTDKKTRKRPKKEPKPAVATAPAQQTPPAQTKKPRGDGLNLLNDRVEKSERKGEFELLDVN